VTLLAPGAMLLAAGLAVPPLVIFYLLKLRRRPMRVTSTMLWDQAQKDLEVNVPFRWIRPSWLLILHALILLALLVAIGRPAIEDAGAGTGRVFLLIDRSASMSAPADGGTRLEAAKALARERAGVYGESASPPEVTVVAFAAEAVVVGPPSREAGTVRAMIDGITPTDQPGDPRAALELVRALTTAAASADDEGEPPGAAPLALLITDGGGAGDLPPRAGDARVRTLIAGAGERAPRNVGITGFAADREIETPSFVRVFLRAIGTAPGGASVPVVVRLDGEAIARKAVTIPPARGAAPGEQAESFRLDIPEGGVLSVTLERDDDLAADNTVFGVLPPVRRPAVLLVVPDASGAGDALSGAGAGGPAAARGARRDRDRGAPRDRPAPVRGQRGDDRARLRAGDLRPGAPAGDAPGAQPELRRPAPGACGGGRLRGGGGPHGRARVGPRSPGDAGCRARPGGDRGPPAVPGRRRGGSGDDGGPGGLDDREPPRRTTLARGGDGPLILALDDGGVRRIAVAFALTQTNWPVDFSFPIFVLSAFDWLVPGADSAVWERTDEAVVLAVPPGASRVVLDGPGAGAIGLDPGLGDGGVPIGVPERVGLSRVSFEGRGEAGGPGEAGRPLAVNLLDPDESSLAVRAPGADGDEGTGAAIGGAGEGQREVWRWFVLAAGIGLLLEYLVYTLRARA
jgi:hypothetical protein